MSVGKVFPGEEMVDFFRQGPTVVKLNFIKSKLKETFFCYNVIRRITNFKIQGVQYRSLSFRNPSPQNSLVLTLFDKKFCMNVNIKRRIFSCIEPHFNFHSRFSSRESEGSAASGGLEIPHGFQQPLIVLLAPQQDTTKSGRR